MTDTKILKTLTDTTYDSVEGYRKAAEKADNPSLKKALNTRMQKRQKTLDTLNAELVRCGGDKVTSGTTAGGLHRLWVSVTDALDDGDEAAAERVEEGEDYLRKKFEEALEKTDLDPQQKSVIQKCHAEVAEGERFGDLIAKMTD